jgi:hypothetical protein
MQPVHFENLFVGIDVDTDLAELVDDDGVMLTARFAEDAVEQGSLS